jgi:hypothetical protein
MAEITGYILSPTVTGEVHQISINGGVADFSVTGIPWDIVNSTFVKNASLGSSFLWTNGIVDVSVAGGGGVSKIYVDGSLGLRDVSILWLQNNTLNISSLAPYATNASVGLAIAPFVTNSSINTAAFAKNASLGLYATNASVGLAIAPFATNSSVGSALQPFATNASIGTAAFAKNASIGGIAGKNFWTGTDASYTALGSYDSNTIYFTT